MAKAPPLKLTPTVDELKELMIEKAGLAMNEGSVFGPGGEGFMRLNIACPKNVLQKALDQSSQALNDDCLL